MSLHRAGFHLDDGKRPGPHGSVLAMGKSLWSRYGVDQIPAAAASVAFFALLAIFPGIGAFVSLYGLFADVGEAQQHIQALSGLLPGGALVVVGDQMHRLAAAPKTGLSAAFAVSLIVSIWSANAGTKALFQALNNAYEAHEQRGFFTLNLVSLAFTAGATVLAVFSFSAMVAVPPALWRLGFGDFLTLSLIRWPLLLALVISGLSVIYRYGPCRPRAAWRWVTPGGVLGGAGWVAVSVLFSWFVGHFGHFNRTYGSLGAVIGFMTWIWISVIIVLLGAELNALLEPNHGRS